MREGQGETIGEPAREVPVYGHCDVLVVGGGPAGTAAAVAAAREGADVVLLERYGHLGGLATGGLVFWIDRMNDWDGNLVWNVKSGKCPPRSICGKHPKLANMSLAQFDPEPLLGSPVVDRVRAANGVSGDFRRTRRPDDGTADIGAIESRPR